MHSAVKITMATELAFNELRNSLAKMGVPVNDCMGLMYLPTSTVTRQFQDACRAVLKDLGVEF